MDGAYWSGKLELGGGRNLRLVLHVPDSLTSVTLDSPDQGAYGLDCKIVCLEADSINIAIPKLMLSYSGKVDGDVMSGIFQQGGARLPLTFERVRKEVNRPQTPVPPFPYDEEVVRIENAGGSHGRSWGVWRNRADDIPGGFGRYP